MSDLKLSLDEILSEMGVDTQISNQQKNSVLKQKPIEAKDFSGIKAIENSNSDNKNVIDYLKISNKFKLKANEIKNKTTVLLILFFISFYVSIANVFEFNLPKFLIFIDYPYIFTIFNVFIHILALILCVDIIYDGFKNILKPNMNTVSITGSFFILAHTLSIIFIDGAIAFLPLTPVAILVLYYKNKSSEFLIRSKSTTFKVCSMSTNIAFVSNNNSTKNGHIYKKNTDDVASWAKNINTRQTNPYIKFYFALTLVFCIGYSWHISNGDFSTFFWFLSVFGSIISPLNLILAWTLPYKYTSRTLFNNGVAIKSYNDIKKLKKSRIISLTDRDLFPNGTISINSLTLHSNFSTEQILAISQSGFSALNLSATQAFDAEMQNRNLQKLPCNSIDNVDKNGFSYTIGNKNISIGNSFFVTTLGITTSEGFHEPNSIFIIVNAQIVAVLTLKYIATHKVYQFIEDIEKESIKIVVTSHDFSINNSMLSNLFDISSNTLYSEPFSSMHARITAEFDSADIILNTRYTGESYVKSVLTAKRLVNSVHTNVILGFLSFSIGAIICIYFMNNYDTTVFLPHNVILFQMFWFVPSVVNSYLQK